MATMAPALRRQRAPGGCEYGRASRARLETLARDLDLLRGYVDRVDGKLNAILGVVLVQLLAFFVAVVIFLLYHTGGT